MQLKGFCTQRKPSTKQRGNGRNVCKSHYLTQGLVDTLPPPQGAPGHVGREGGRPHLSTPSSLPLLQGPPTPCTVHVSPHSISHQEKPMVALLTDAETEAQKFTKLLKVTQ